MSSSYGPKKGGAFERKIAKEIAAAFAHKGIEQLDCWRSVASGGHAISAGDIRMSKRLLKIFPFAIECKCRKSIHWENFLLKKESSEQRWLKQAVQGATKFKNLHPILVLKANRQPIYVMDPLTLRMMKWERFLKRWAKGATLWVKAKGKKTGKTIS